jgi:hypothetical protein
MSGDCFAAARLAMTDGLSYQKFSTRTRSYFFLRVLRDLRGQKLGTMGALDASK